MLCGEIDLTVDNFMFFQILVQILPGTEHFHTHESEQGIGLV